MSEENNNTEPEQSAENIPKEIIGVDETHKPKSESDAVDKIAARKVVICFMCLCFLKLINYV